MMYNVLGAALALLHGTQSKKLKCQKNLIAEDVYRLRDTAVTFETLLTLYFKQFTYLYNGSIWIIDYAVYC